MEEYRAQLSALYRTEITLLSPLHIGGSGNRLMPNLDYYAAEDRIVVVDPDAVVTELGADALEDLPEQFNLPTLVRLLHERGGTDALARTTRYALPLLEGVGEIVPQLKDAFGYPYLPGSSLKGAWRTALAWALCADDPTLSAQTARRYRVLAFANQLVGPIFNALNASDRSERNPRALAQALDWRRLVREALHPAEGEIDECARAAQDVFSDAVFELCKDKVYGKKRWDLRTVQQRLKIKDREADDALERVLFGQNPNFDALRMIQVSDSGRIDATALALGRATVYAKRASGELEEQSPIFLEYLPPGTMFALTTKVDRFLSSVPRTMAREEKPRRVADHLRTRALAMDSEKKIASACRRFADQVVKGEVAFLADVKGLASVRAFYQRLQNQLASLQEHECLVQMAWGAGWTSKTLGPFLKTDADAFRALWAQYWGTRDRPQLVGDFPTSCKLVQLQDGSLAPLGWVKVTFTPAEATIHPAILSRVALSAIPLPSTLPLSKPGEPKEVTKEEATLTAPQKKRAKERVTQPSGAKKISASEKAKREQEEIMKKMQKKG